jgi:solute carrier family 25 S-adenosylmethionine transporter 26
MERQALPPLHPFSPMPALKSCTALSLAQPPLQVPLLNKRVANILAATFAAFVTAVIEAPVELFRHNQQAGLVSRHFFHEMVSAVRRNGPAGECGRAASLPHTCAPHPLRTHTHTHTHTHARTSSAGLYWGFLPHCFEAWPHDISELLVIGGMKDMQVIGMGCSREGEVQR